jgi:hypothetical protein
MMRLSTQPPKWAARKPALVPMSAQISEPTSAMTKVVWVAISKLLSKSRPIKSVPSR